MSTKVDGESKTTSSGSLMQLCRLGGRNEQQPLRKNKFGFIDGSIPTPGEGSAEFSLWKRSNAMIRGWLHSSIEKEICSSVKHAKTAREVWKDLEERFGNESAPRAYELKREITLTHQERLSVLAYYTKREIILTHQEAIALSKASSGAEKL
ncbi:hypothetical protein QQ045_004589 [Rhodiola kirilowii]